MKLKNSIIVFVYLLVIAFAFFVFACKTKPDVKPPEETTTTSTTTTSTTLASTTTTQNVTTTSTTTTTVVFSSSLSEMDIKEVNDLIDKAIKANAEKYDPDNLFKAKNFFDSSKKNNSKDDLDKAKEHAKLAYENSLIKRALEKKDVVEKLFLEAESIAGDKLFSSDYSDSKKFYDEGNGSFDNKDYITSFNKYSDSENKLKNLIDKTILTRKEIENKIDYIKKLIGEAEKIGAKEYAKDDLNSANVSLEDGVKFYLSLDYDNTKPKLDEAEKYAISAIDKTKFAIKEKKRKEALKAIMEAGKKLEDASKIPSLNDKGEKVYPDSYKFKLDDKKTDLNNAPSDEELTTLSYKDVLTKAIDYINKAKESYQNEDYEMAIQYAIIAKKLADSYKGTGIKTYYTVRLIPERRDCLWRIAEYDFIYKDPFLWPRIWKTNKKEILNPDLIFPKQVFVIPEVE
ncbi:MAG TPA: hypothetical protein PK771_05020 [Spirochaetota bacterium]|nr:hypothetical protein [Spirochaetota bacterium]